MGMTRTLQQLSGRTLAIALAAAILVACAEQAPLAPEADSALPAAFAAVPKTGPATASPKPDLGPCPELQVSSDSKLAFRVFAVGVQIYRWDGATWAFVAPDATLYADGAGRGVVGTHYAGPTWESNSGSKVVGTVLKRCTASASAIQWLLLGSVSEGPGVFHRIEYIQRLNTVGGVAPTTPGTSVGEQARVPYTTDYYFYRAR
jgi:hypothetical protein